MPRLWSYTLAFALQRREKHGKTSVRVRRTLPRSWWPNNNNNNDIYFFRLQQACTISQATPTAPSVQQYALYVKYPGYVIILPFAGCQVMTYGTMQSEIWRHVFRRNLMPPSSGSATSVTSSPEQNNVDPEMEQVRAHRFWSLWDCVCFETAVRCRFCDNCKRHFVRTASSSVCPCDTCYVQTVV